MSALILIILALIGVPLFAVIALGAIIGFHTADYDLQLVAIEFFRLSEMQILIC